MVSTKPFFEKFYLLIVFLKHMMEPSTKLDETLEGTHNFWEWKYRVVLILEENDLEDFCKRRSPSTWWIWGQRKVQEEDSKRILS